MSIDHFSNVTESLMTSSLVDIEVNIGSDENVELTYVRPCVQFV